MKCSNPPALTDHELLAYVDGEAPPALLAHLQRCPACRQRAAQLAAEEAQIVRQLTYQATCPPPTVLEQYYLGELPPLQEDAVAKHLATDCKTCQKMVAQFMTQLADFAPTPAPSPTPQPGLLDRLKQQIEVVIAELVTPSQPAFALRGEATPPPLTYRAEAVEVRLDIQPDIGSDHKVVIGQVKAEPLESNAFQAELYQGDQLVASTQVASKRGRFQFPPLAPGVYTLVLRHPQLEVRLPQVQCR
ncbi:MAG: zf-HC2 domain-containing protein [Caldilineaceae bacterium]